MATPSKSGGYTFEPWDPTKLSSEVDAGSEGQAALSGHEIAQSAHTPSDKQRRTLFEVRERLQRAIIAGERFNCVERSDQRVEGYEAVVASSHKVLGNAQTEVLFAPNSATALLLSRQFEGISRKDLLVQESDERLELTAAFYAIVRLQMQNEHQATRRQANAAREQGHRRESEWRSTLATRFQELESSCRRRTEAAAEECCDLLNKELSRAFDLLHVGHNASQRNWLVQQEERSRHALILEADRSLSRTFGQQLSEAQGITVRTLLKEKVPMNNLALLDASPQTSSRHEPPPTFGVATGVRTTTRSETSTSRKLSAGLNNDDTSDFGDDVVPSIPAPTGLDASETATQVSADLPSSFTPYWGFMFRSTGVLMSWQRRFFVLTSRGKLKCATSDKGPWSVVVSAHNILKVEVDSYHDTAATGAAPPTSQYHQYGFYIDAVDPNQPTKQRRLRFCCFSRAELRAWLSVLRRATDLVVTLEEQGALPPSPRRRHLHKISSKAAELGWTTGSHLYSNPNDDPLGMNATGTSPPSYRRRMQLEEDVTSISRHRQQLEKHREQVTHADAADPSLLHSDAHYPVKSAVFGAPPMIQGSAEQIAEELAERARQQQRAKEAMGMLH